MPLYIALNFFENLCEMPGLYETAESKKVFRDKNEMLFLLGLGSGSGIIFLIFVWAFFRSSFFLPHNVCYTVAICKYSPAMGSSWLYNKQYERAFVYFGGSKFAFIESR